VIERYTLPEIGVVWTEEAKYHAWLRVELAVSRARAQLGEIPTEEVEELAEKADFTVGRIHEIEQETNHDVIAFVTNVAEYAGDVARHFHFGLTSSDVLDTAGALQLKEALDLIFGEARALTLLLTEMALGHRDTVMIGRTHGVHAEPTAPTRTSTRRSRRSLARSSAFPPRRPRPRSCSATGTLRFSPRSPSSVLRWRR
jgi:adenylosuccinate lyase